MGASGGASTVFIGAVAGAVAVDTVGVGAGCTDGPQAKQRRLKVNVNVRVFIPRMLKDPEERLHSELDRVMTNHHLCKLGSTQHTVWG